MHASLDALDPDTFEHLANELCLRVLGAGHSTFGPGADGGRDGLFEGTAPYPSSLNPWHGVWYIQSKYHSPHLSKDPNKWLVARVTEELLEFSKPETKRKWPNVWIIITNIDPSGVPESGAFDACRALVQKKRPSLAKKFAIWGGAKVLAFLSEHKDIAERYGHFLTPGDILAAMFADIQSTKASRTSLIRHLVVDAIEDQRHTRLEQANSIADNPPSVHELFTELPFTSIRNSVARNAAADLFSAGAATHSAPQNMEVETWREWLSEPRRSQIWLIRGGPGQGKSTLTQYYCQVQRSALLLGPGGPKTVPDTKRLAFEIRTQAERMGLWPVRARIPVYCELRQYAQWFSEQEESKPRGVLTFLSVRYTAAVQEAVPVSLLRQALGQSRWVIVFDGLDEVPSDIRENIAAEVCKLFREVAVEADILVLCTTRPQGYSGQFDSLGGAVVNLAPLPKAIALECAERLIRLRRPVAEADYNVDILKNAMKSASVAEIMTTPLQSHIMAIIVRGGRRPPERKWQLYQQFFDVMAARESDRRLVDAELSRLFQQELPLIRAVHNRAGFVLHSKAELATGAGASLSRDEFQAVVRSVVEAQKEHDVDRLVAVVMRAATERLVLLTTPDDGAKIRFDIRQLQEFFAAEFIYQWVDPTSFAERFRCIAADAHWREVVHFVVSALVETNRLSELRVSISILQEVDEGENAAEREIARRLARGANIAGRLLEDGVLEQNRQVRNLFRERLVPLAESSDGTLLEPLLRVRGDASINWLLEVFLAQIESGAIAQAPGAVIVAWNRLGNESHQLGAWERAFEQCLLDGGAHVLWEAILNPVLRPNVLRPKKHVNWHAAWIAKVLFESSAQVPGLFELPKLFDSVRPSDDEVLATAVSNAAVLTYGAAAGQFLSLLWNPRRSSKEVPLFRFSNVEILRRGAEDLVSLRRHVEQIMSIATQVPQSGSVAALMAFFRVSLYPSSKHLREWAEFAPCGLSLGYSWFRELAPIGVINDPQLVLINHPTDEGLMRWWEQSSPFWGREEVLHHRPGRNIEQITPEDYIQLLAAAPRTGVYLWASDRSCNDPDVLAAVKTIFERGPDWAADLPDTAWGVIGSAFSKDDALLDLIGTIPCNIQIEVHSWRRPPQAEVPVPPINLRTMRPAFVVKALTSALWIASLRGAPTASAEISTRACGDYVRQCGAQAPDLLNAADNVGWRDEERAAALLLYLLHPDSDWEQLYLRSTLLVQLADLNSQAVPALAIVADARGSERIPEFVAFIGDLIHRIRVAPRNIRLRAEHRETYKLWERIFARWRERSTAPVSHGDPSLFSLP